MTTAPDTALVVIDVQEEYFSGGLQIEHPARGGSLARIGAAMDAATAAGTPVVVVRQNGPDGLFVTGAPTWALRPEVADRHRDLLVDKTLPGAFTGTELGAWLDKRRIGHVTIAGYMTNVCCDTTARQAIHRGMGATLLHDATGVPSMPDVAGRPIAPNVLHGAALAPLVFVGVELTTTEAWIEERRSVAAA